MIDPDINSKKTTILIDGAYEEEQRIIVLEQDRIVDFNIEDTHNKETRGNIYLGKITRIESSLNAVFVDIGQERSGFLPFSEVHPEYYNIKSSEKEELLKNINMEQGITATEIPGRKKYFIRDVLAVGQVMLVQVSRSSKGNKGNLLTTFVSLLGRFCVLQPHALVPNIGISQKISGNKRATIREIAKECQDLFAGHSVIIRTNSNEASKIEIKKDLEYLLKLWDLIRKQAVQNVAPSMIYEEGDMIVQTLRDLHNNNISEIVISGEEVYKKAQFFMKLLLPQHIDKIKLHQDSIPLFHKFKVEEKIDEIYRPIVHLPSGGTIVISLTEALVAIDVNSGKSKKGRNVAEIAVHTNFEAATEIARQLKLRDLSGVIVIDFIDMPTDLNRTELQQHMTELLKNDKSKITLLPISDFGLMQISRQRIRPSFLENKTSSCVHCLGSGMTQNISLISLRILRQLGFLLSALIKGQAYIFVIRGHTEVVANLINVHRKKIHHIEDLTGCIVHINVDMGMTCVNTFMIDKKDMNDEHIVGKNTTIPMISWKDQWGV